MRKLASVRMINDLIPVNGADRIELARIDGWQTVVRKGEFQVGDKCVYFEVDSVLPDRPEFKFMANRKFRVKTIKLRGAISQGVAMPLSDCKISENVEIDKDLTNLLGVKRYEPKQGRSTEPGNYSLRKKKRLSWYKTFPVIKYLYSFWDPYSSRQFPPFVRKTDEVRVQNIRNLDLLLKGRSLLATEKLDGQSATYFFNKRVRVGWKYGLFGVCSRNIWLRYRKNNNWWKIAKQFKIEKKLKNFCLSRGRSLAIQGEIIGSGVQGNKYEKSGLDFYVFNVYDIDKQRLLSNLLASEIVNQLGLKLVPAVKLPKDLELTAKGFLDAADGQSAIANNKPREGIVVRDWINPAISFKAVSNWWLLKYE